MFDATPDDWTAKTLGDLADISRGTSWRDENETSADADDALPVLGIKNVQANLDLTNITWLKGLGASAIKSSTVECGDILMVGSNGNPSRIGNAVRVDARGRFLYASLLFGLRPREHIVDGEFLFHLIRSTVVQTAISDTVQGSTGLSNLKISVLRDIPIHLPPPDEQRRIAEVLRSVDATVATTETTIEAAARLKSAIVEDFLASAALSYQSVRLESVIRCVDSGWSPDCEMVPASIGQWGVLKTSSVTWSGYDDEENKALPADLEARASLEVKPGDILITRAGQAYRTGVVALVDATAGMRMISDKLVRIRADESRILPVFLSEALKSKSVQKQLSPLKSGLTTLTNITQKMIRGLDFPLPSLESQCNLSTILLPLDQTIADCRAQLRDTGVLKAALANDLLSGRVRVPA